MGNKSGQSFERVAQLKEEFRHLSSETIATRLGNFSRSNDISIAYKQILKERGINDYLLILLEEKDNNK